MRSMGGIVSGDFSSPTWLCPPTLVYGADKGHCSLAWKGILFDSPRWDGRTGADFVLQSYLRSGWEVLRNLRGNFAFFLFDGRDQSFFCARSSCGGIPLYWSETKEGFLFGYDQRLLLETGKIVPEPDWNSLYLSAIFGSCLSPLTAFRNIHCLEPGHFLRGKSGRVIRHGAFWEVPLDQEDHVTEKEALSGLKEITEQAVRRTTSGLDRVAVLLSGGIDSTTVAAIASKQVETVGFTLCSHGETDGEFFYSKGVAEHLGIDCHPVYVEAEELVDLLTEQAVLTGEPVGLDPTLLMGKEISRLGFSTVLTGAGGDESMAGMGRDRMILRYWPILSRLRFAANLFPDSVRVSPFKKVALSRSPEEFFLNFQPGAFLLRQGHLFAPEIDVTPENPLEFLNRRFQLTKKSFSNALQCLSYLTLQFTLDATHARSTSQLLQPLGVEARNPLLDPDFLDFCFRLPASLKIRGGKGKYLLRRLAHTYYPAGLNVARKRGFGLGLVARVFSQPLIREWLEDELATLKRRYFFNPDILEICLERAGKEEYSDFACFFLSFELWYKRFFSSHVPPAPRERPFFQEPFVAEREARE